jgi:hypothetical protein
MEDMSTICVAREGVGKSLFDVNLANAVANGLSFLGQTHKPRPVLYLDRENPLAVVEKRAKEFNIRSGGNLKYVGLYAHNGEVPNPVTFAKGELPPVNAFWSVTMYDGKSQLLIENPISRYLNKLSDAARNEDERRWLANPLHPERLSR